VFFHTLTLCGSLKEDTTRMNDSNKHKVTGQMNHQTADPKANASVFLFFSNAHFLKTILTSRTNGTFGFARHTCRPFAKPKEPFFANAPFNINSILSLNKSLICDSQKLNYKYIQPQIFIS
jgi:hypothetical protein